MQLVIEQTVGFLSVKKYNSIKKYCQGGKIVNNYLSKLIFHSRIQSQNITTKEKWLGYLIVPASAFSFANEVPGVFTDAKKADGFVKITEVKPSHRTNIAASICENCKTVILKY